MFLLMHRLRVSELLKNHALIQDRDLAHEILIAKVTILLDVPSHNNPKNHLDYCNR